VNAGELIHRLIFKQMDAVDNSGYPIPEGIDYAKAWGSLKTLKGRTRYLAAQSKSENNREFIIRYQKKLLNSERPRSLYVYWRDEKHEIESIEDDDGLRKSMTVILKVIK
jgi:SPP1 family predicted phage head-tail adaptor